MSLVPSDSSGLGVGGHLELEFLHEEKASTSTTVNMECVSENKRFDSLMHLNVRFPKELGGPS